MSESQQKRLYRLRNDRMAGGVAGGIAEYFDIDPIMVRLGFVLLTIGGGAGILITPADGKSAPMLVYPRSTSKAGFTLSLTGIPAASTSYSFEYFIVQ